MSVWGAAPSSIIDVGIRSHVFYVCPNVPKAALFQWLTGWARDQHCEAWAVYAGATIKAGWKTTVKELERRWSGLPERQPDGPTLEAEERPR